MSKYVQGIREVKFYLDNKETEPKDIFEKVYSPLNELIEFNRKFLSRSKSGRLLTREDQYNIHKKVLSKLHKIEGVTVTLFTDYGKKDFDIRARTNFRKSITKMPNIIYLINCNDVLFLREARDYQQNPLVEKDARSRFKRRYKGVVKSKKKTGRIFKKGIYALPEPRLVLALERIYRDKGITRITPRSKIVRVRKNSIAQIRDSLLHIRDSHLDFKSLMEYQGILNGLGLMDVLDQDYSHYCIDNCGSVVNIDPDFWVYTGDERYISHLDWPEFKRIFLENYPMTKRDFLKLARIKNQTIKKTREKLGKKLILDYLPETLKEARDLEKIVSEDAFY